MYVFSDDFRINKLGENKCQIKLNKLMYILITTYSCTFLCMGLNPKHWVLTNCRYTYISQGPLYTSQPTAVNIENLYFMHMPN